MSWNNEDNDRSNLGRESEQAGSGAHEGIQANQMNQTNPSNQTSQAEPTNQPADAAEPLPVWRWNAEHRAWERVATEATAGNDTRIGAAGSGEWTGNDSMETAGWQAGASASSTENGAGSANRPAGRRAARRAGTGTSRVSPAGKVLAVALSAVLVAGSVAGGYTIANLNNRLDSQASVISSLQSQLSEQSALAATTKTVKDQVESLTSVVDKLAENGAIPAAGSSTLAGAAGSVVGIGASQTEASVGTAASGLVDTSLTKGSSVTAIAKAVSPSVVGIRMTVTTSGRRFSSSEQTSEGSGIIIRSDGYIVTNYHVVSYEDPNSGYADNTTLEVFLADGRSAQATYVGGDSENDLAVLKIDLDNLTVAELGNSSELEVGELAVAIGNPLGMEFAGSVTVGVVSALNRQIEGSESSLNLIQTDAAINPGNSGGALINSAGQIVGINSSKIAQTDVEGLGFAIAIDDAKPIINSLILYGYVMGRPSVGIEGQDISEVMSQMYGLPVGIYVTAVGDGTAAAKAGLQVGDVITAIAGTEVTTMSEFNAVKKQYKAGDTVKITISRNNTDKTLSVTLDEAK